MTEKPIKKLYKVETEVLAPVKVIYKIYALSPEDALKLCEKQGQIISIKPSIKQRIKLLQAKVYLFGTSMLALSKKF